MWWWQSQELAGAFNFGGSVPVDHLTCCAAALRVPEASKPAAAPADMTFSNSRRPHGVPGMISSRSFARNLTTSIGPSSRLVPSALQTIGALDCDIHHP